MITYSGLSDTLTPKQRSSAMTTWLDGRDAYFKWLMHTIGGCGYGVSLHHFPKPIDAPGVTIVRLGKKGWERVEYTGPLNEETINRAISNEILIEIEAKTVTGEPVWVWDGWKFPCTKLFPRDSEAESG